jgi:hypothetical protein
VHSVGRRLSVLLAGLLALVAGCTANAKLDVVGIVPTNAFTIRGGVVDIGDSKYLYIEEDASSAIVNLREIDFRTSRSRTLNLRSSGCSDIQVRQVWTEGAAVVALVKCSSGTEIGGQIGKIDVLSGEFTPLEKSPMDLVALDVAGKRGVGVTGSCPGINTLSADDWVPLQSVHLVDLGDWPVDRVLAQPSACAQAGYVASLALRDDSALIVAGPNSADRRCIDMRDPVGSGNCDVLLLDTSSRSLRTLAKGFGDVMGIASVAAGAVLSASHNGTTGVYLITMDGRVSMLLEGDTSSPSVSPDGQVLVALASGDRTAELVRLRPVP